MILFLPKCSFLAVFATLIVRDTTAYSPNGIQSGPDFVGSAFASSGAYDVTTNAVYITGSSFGNTFDSDGQAGHVFDGSSNDIYYAAGSVKTTSSCFLTIASLPEPGESDSPYGPNSAISWIESQIIHNSNNGDPYDSSVTLDDERCTAVLFHNGFASVAGYNGNRPGTVSTLESLQERDAIDVANTTGFVAQIDRTKLDLNGQSLPVIGGEVLDDWHVQYPVALYGKPGETYMYVVLEMSPNTRVSTSAAASARVVDEDPYRTFPLGKPLAIEVKRFQWKTTLQPSDLSPTNLQRTLESEWSKSYGTKNAQDVYVTGITETADGSAVIMAGHTTGSGAVFGGLDNVTTITSEDNMDGFITKLNPSTGTYSGSSRRLKSDQFEDIFITGLCTPPPTSRGAAMDLYVVGWTTGDGIDDIVHEVTGTRAFLMKLDANTLETMWTIEVGKSRTTGDDDDDIVTVKAWGCAVVPDGSAVYVGGNIGGDGVLPDAGITTSNGQTDVFVSLRSAEDGSMIFTRQFGSSKVDEIARKNGLLVDSDGNAIVVGNTYGSMYRTRSTLEGTNVDDKVDIFVTTISRTSGDIALPNGSSQADITGSTTSLTPTTTVEETDDQAPPVEVIPMEQAAERHRRWASLVATLVLLIVAVIIGAIYINRRMAYKEVTTDRDKVLAYMGCFDVEEIDLKHSATGGWHCSYAGDLALGRNRKLQLPDYFSPFRNSSNDKNKLGDDDDDDDNLGLIDPLNPTSLYHAPGSERLIISDPKSMNKPRTSRSGLLNDNNDVSIGTSSVTRSDGYSGLISSEYNTTWGNSEGNSSKSMTRKGNAPLNGGTWS